MQTEIEFEMAKPYFTSEEEIRLTIINALFRRGVIVWNCGAEGNQCPDPVVIRNLPLVPVNGDFVFLNKGKYRVGEIKISKESCRYILAKKSYEAGRDTPIIPKEQICLLRKGGGILIIVAESPPSTVSMERPKGVTKEICEKEIREKYHRLVGESKIPYEVYLLNQKRFEIFYQEFLESSSWKVKKWRDVVRYYKRLNLTELNKLVPESKVLLTINDFLDGRIADEIMNILEGE